MEYRLAVKNKEDENNEKERLQEWHAELPMNMIWERTQLIASGEWFQSLRDSSYSLVITEKWSIDWP